jgi:hypothetical protein
LADAAGLAHNQVKAAMGSSHCRHLQMAGNAALNSSADGATAAAIFVAESVCLLEVFLGQRRMSILLSLSPNCREEMRICKRSNMRILAATTNIKRDSFLK